MVFTANELILTNFFVSAPINGKRYWKAFISGENFNSASPLMQASVLELSLNAFGNNIRILNMNCLYNGATAGVTLSPGFKLADNTSQYGEKLITSYASDSCFWQLDWFIPGKGYAGAYSLWFTVAGYGATDDIYINLNGEVWQ